MLACSLLLVGSLAAAADRPGAILVWLDLSQGRGESTEQLLLKTDLRLLLADGTLKATSDLRVGDRLRLEADNVGLVTAQTPYLGRPPEAGRVIGRSRHLVRELQLLRTTAEVVETTPDHLFKVVGSGWTEAKRLAPGDLIATTDAHQPARVVSSERRSVAPTPVYNLLVEGTHIYHVGREGLLVHNTVNKPCVPGPETAANVFSRAARLAQGLPAEDLSTSGSPRVAEVEVAAAGEPELARRPRARATPAPPERRVACNSGNCDRVAKRSSREGFGGVLFFEPAKKIWLNPAEAPGENWSFHAVNVKRTSGRFVIHDTDQWITAEGRSLDEVAGIYTRQMFPGQQVEYAYAGFNMEDTLKATKAFINDRSVWRPIPKP